VYICVKRAFPEKKKNIYSISEMGKPGNHINDSKCELPYMYVLALFRKNISAKEAKKFHSLRD
jgi:hypothetical protein